MNLTDCCACVRGWVWGAFRVIAAMSMAASPLAAVPATAAQTLTVSAAASLSDAFREIGKAFEATRPAVAVRFNFAASGVLLQQLAQGAPVDVLATADTETMQRATERKLVDAATRRDFAGNTLVLVTPSSDAGIKSLADVRQPAVRRIALGKPALVPAGRYARNALEQTGLLPLLEPRLVPADSVRQVLDYVARGEVEAGFVYRTDAMAMPDRVRIVQTVATPAPITYPAAVVSDSRHASLGREFVQFLASDAAQQILARYGFGRA